MADSPADGQRIAELNLGEDAWISLVIRDGHLIPVQGSTSLRAGDEVIAVIDPGRARDLDPVFTTRTSSGPASAGTALSAVRVTGVPVACRGGSSVVVRAGRRSPRREAGSLPGSDSAARLAEGMWWCCRRWSKN